MCTNAFAAASLAAPVTAWNVAELATRFRSALALTARAESLSTAMGICSSLPPPAARRLLSLDWNRRLHPPGDHSALPADLPQRVPGVIVEAPGVAVVHGLRIGEGQVGQEHDLVHLLVHRHSAA